VRGPPVVRVWKGQGTPDGVARYSEEHFPERVLPQLRDIDGFLEARVLVRTAEDKAEVVVMTTWESLEAVKAFTGESYERAVVEPAVSELLERFDDEVTHYTIAHDVR
jgi:heme-degrading monooxygenase HmoA